MSFNISNLITDRTYADVLRWIELRNKGYSSMTAAEQTEWLAGMKGAYNATDLNRVSTAVEYIAGRLREYGYDPKVNKVYIQRPDKQEIVQQEVEKDVETQMTTSNVSTFFNVTNGGYYFSGSDGTWASNNKGVDSSTATSTFTALKAVNVSFTYSYSSESNYDKFTLKVGNVTVVDGVSGSLTTKTYSAALQIGESIVLTYTKDSSSSSGSDRCTMSNLVVKYKEMVIEDVLVITPDPRDPNKWYMSDIPTEEQMTVYLQNIANIRSALPVFPTTPDVPADMEYLSYEEANAIEKILVDMETLINNMMAAWFYCGEIECGEVNT